jgi:hypothetical protein
MRIRVWTILLVLAAAGTAVAFSDDVIRAVNPGWQPAGTLIPELSTPTARHFAGGDGTITAVIEQTGPGPDPRPFDWSYLSTTYTCRTESIYGMITDMTKTDGPWYTGWNDVYGMAWIVEHGFGEWDISSIPNNATVASVRCSVYCLSSGYAMPSSVSFADIISKPSSTLDPLALHNDGANGRQYGSLVPAVNQWRWLTLANDTLVQYRLNNGDWFAVGTRTGTGTICEVAFSPALLSVTYTVPASHDVGCTQILAPAGLVDSGLVFAPACSVRNYTAGAETYTVRMRIGPNGAYYDNTATVTNHPGNTTQHLAFPTVAANWPRNIAIAVSCSTELATDAVPANDKATTTVSTRVYDAQALGIINPVGTVDSGWTGQPQVEVRNRGTLPATFGVLLTITGGYAQAATATNVPPGDNATVTFPNWTAPGRGAFNFEAITQLGSDMVGSNDTCRSTVNAAVRDVACNAITAPLAADSGVAVSPQAQVQNRGTDPASFTVRFAIDGGYTDDQFVSSLAPGAALLVGFAPWTPNGRGAFGLRCSTLLASDMVSDNDLAIAAVNVAVHDVAATAILAPGGVIYPGPVVPVATFRNAGTGREPCAVHFAIPGAGYADAVSLPDGLPFADTAVAFAGWNAAAGSFVGRCSVALAGDQQPANNVATRPVQVLGQPYHPGWYEDAMLPSAGRPPKDGAWLVCDTAARRVYAAAGNKTSDCFVYAIDGDFWQSIAPLPVGGGRLPKKGAAATLAPGGQIYATKGNNTQEFYRFDGDLWRAESLVPLGPTGKKVKGGTDLVYVDMVDSGFVYLLKGYKSEFWRYQTDRRQWEQLASAPAERWKPGSWLAYDGGQFIYAHQAKEHGFFRFNVALGAWEANPLPGMPRVGMMGRTKKSKDGGAGDFLGGYIYALKGGNTQEFWRYTIGDSSGYWTELETIPAYGRSSTKRKRVKGGGSLAAGDGILYALKGNKSFEFWQYTPHALFAAGPARDGVQAAGGDRPAAGLITISPNPASGRVLVSSSLLPATGDLSIYDAAGRLVLVSGLGRAATELDLRRLATGVYLVRLRVGDQRATRKLVIDR